MVPHLVHIEGGTYSGSTRVVLDLASRVDPAKFRSSICYFAVSPPTQRAIADADARGICWASVVKKSRYDASSVPRLRAALNALAPDIVVLHGFGAYGLGTLPARLSGARTVIRVEHNPEITNRLRWLTSAASARWVDGALGVSQYLLDALAAIGISLPRAEVLYNGVEQQMFAGIRREPFTDQVGPPVVTMMARLDTQKDHATLLRATAALKRSGQEIRLRLAGDGPLASALASEARALGITENVEWLGFQPDVVALLEDTDIAILSTHFEGFGLVVAEAMAAARPVIATDVGPLRELITSGTTGILVPPQDATSLATAISFLVANPAHARAMGLLARDTVARRFTFDATLRAFTDYVTRVHSRP